MRNRQKEIIFLRQVRFNAADDCRAIRVANLFANHPDRISALVAQRAREKIRPVVQLFGGRVNSILVSCGIARAEGASFSTVETVPGVNPKCCATALRVMACGFWPGFVFLAIILRAISPI